MVGIVFCNELNMCPYLDKYIDVLEKKGKDYRILLWDRTGGTREYGEHYIVYRRKSELYIPKIRKISAFAGFRLFLDKELRRNSFDKLIILTTLPAVLIYPLLTNRYRKRYIFDFRDMSYEWIPAYRNIVEKLIEYSSFTCMSSPGYQTVLSGNIVQCHNFKYSDLELERVEIKPFENQIRLLHIGSTRGEEYNKRLADVFGNDDRFFVSIVGVGNDTQTFKDYIKKFNNIIVSGKYWNSEKIRYIDDCDVMLYYYPCTFNNNLALANKYYDGLIFKKPLIGNADTYSGKLIEKNELGLSIRINEEGIADRVFQYLCEMDRDRYLNNASSELRRVITEDLNYVKKIEEFIDSP